MIWYICFAIVILIFALMAKVAFDSRFGRMRIIYVLIGCLLVAYVIYIPPFFKTYDFVPAFFGTLINVLQVISLDSDYLTFHTLLHSDLSFRLFADIYYVILAFVHFLLPALSAMTAVTVIAKCFTALQIKFIQKRKKPIHIFSALTYEATVLGKDIRKHDKKCDILYLDDKNAMEYSELREMLRCNILNEEIEHVKACSKNRQVYYYCVSYDEEKNLNSALSIISNLENKDKALQQNTYIFISTADPNVEMIIDSVNKGFVNISVIDEKKMVAYDLLRRYPFLKYCDGNKISILLCGFSNANKAVLKAASWCGQLYGYDLSLSVVGRNISNASYDFKAEYPGLFTDKYDIEFFSYKNNLEFNNILKDRLSDCNYIVVAEDDCRETIAKAIDLRRFFYRSDPEFKNAPAIFAYIENVEKANAVKLLRTAESKAERRMPYNITPFGMATDIYTFKNITESDIEILAKNVHLVYEDIFSDGPIDVDGALERFNLFEVNKNSNRANALHIRYKLLMLGLDYTDDPDAQEVDLKDYLSDETLEKLTYAEHDRWMAFLESEGWIQSTIEQVEAYKASDISKGRHNCPILKMHPYICPFEDLKDCSDSLGLPDSTVYDRDLISRIPDILHDKWNISGKKFKIIKNIKPGE